MNTDNNFATNLDKIIYSNKPATKKDLTVSDIIKCKGASQGFLGRTWNQLATLWNKHTFVTDAKIKKIFAERSPDELIKIREQFSDSLKAPDNFVGSPSIPDGEKQAKIERRMATDLAKIVEKNIRIPQDSKDENRGQLYLLRQEAQKSQQVLSGVSFMKKFQPIDLLRALAAEPSSTGAKGLKENFREFIKDKNIKDEDALKEAYSAFIKNEIKTKSIPELGEYAKDKSMKDYIMRYTLLISELGDDKALRNILEKPVNEIIAMFALKSSVTKNLEKEAPVEEKAADISKEAQPIVPSQPKFSEEEIAEIDTPAILTAKEKVKNGEEGAQALLAEEYLKLARSACLPSGFLREAKKAEIAYQQAANLGNMSAQTILGDIYYNGHMVSDGYSIPKDPQAAFALYKKVLDQGSKATYPALARCYALGFGVDRDLIEAAKFMKLAKENGVLMGPIYEGNRFLLSQ